MRLPRALYGFTLLELIVTLLIIGILTVAVVPRFFSLQTFTARSFYDQTLATARYAQKVAVAQRTSVQVRVESAVGLVCLKYGDADASVPCSSAQQDVFNPADSKPFRQAVPRDVSVQLNAGSGLAFSFNGLGQPSAPTNLHIEGDGITRTIRVEPETGYVH